MKTKLTTLFDRKLPGMRREPERIRGKRPSWMTAELAELFAQVGPETLFGIHYCRMLSAGECVASRELFTRVDEQGDWFSSTWQPFLEDAGGNVTCVDTKTGAVVYREKSERPRIVAPSIPAYVKIVERVLAKLPDPPDPEEDDIVEEELEEPFEQALRETLLRGAKQAPQPKPRKDVPPKPPPPDESVPKDVHVIASFETTKEYAIPLLKYGGGQYGVGTDLGDGYSTSSVGRRGNCWCIGFVHKKGRYQQADALFVFLNLKTRDAFLTFDDLPEQDVFVKKAFAGLKRMGFKLEPIPAAKTPKRTVTRWARFFAA